MAVSRRIVGNEKYAAICRATTSGSSVVLSIFRCLGSARDNRLARVHLIFPVGVQEKRTRSIGIPLRPLFSHAERRLIPPQPLGLSGLEFNKAHIAAATGEYLDGVIDQRAIFRVVQDPHECKIRPLESVAAYSSAYSSKMRRRNSVTRRR
jgi:hypothetical protein